MLSFVSNNQVLNVLLLIPYAVLLRINAFLHPDIYTVNGSESRLAQWLFSILGDNALFHNIMSTIITVVIAIVLAALCNKHRIFQKQNLLGSYLFILLASILPETHCLSPALLGLLFFTLYVRSCMMIYRYHLNFFELFNMGVFGMLAGLMYPPFFMLLFASLLVILFFEGFNPKQFLLYFFGVASIGIIAWTLFFFFDIHPEREGELLAPSKYIFNPSFWMIERQVYVGILVFLTLFGISRYYSSLKKKVIDARKRISFLYMITALIILIPIFFAATDIHYFVILSLLISILLALHFDGMRNIFFLEGLHLILLVVLFGFQFNFFNL